MISIDLTFDDERMNFRDPISYYFAKWFDEQFTVDILNSLNIYAELTSDEEDKNHIDYKFVLNGNTYSADSKIHVHNFEYTDLNNTKRWTDVISIGNYALYDSDCDYYSFVWRSKLYFISRNKVLNMKPLQTIENSIGQNGSIQNLIQFSVFDLSENCDMCYDISEEKFDSYLKAYHIFSYCRNPVYDMPPEYRKNQELCKQQKILYIKYMKQELETIISEYNKIYNEIPKVNIENNLSDIMNLLD